MNTVKNKIFIIPAIVAIVLAISVIIAPHTHAKEIPYTLEDRDRLIRLEEGVREGFKGVHYRIDGLDKRIGGLQGLMYVVISAVIAQTVGIIGFVLWDRRTALAPAIRKTRELEEREEMIEKILKDLPGRNPASQRFLNRQNYYN